MASSGPIGSRSDWDIAVLAMMLHSVSQSQIESRFVRSANISVILKPSMGISLEDGTRFSPESPQWARFPAFLSVVDEYIEQMYEGLFLKAFAIGIFLRFLLPLMG